jgi:hypothetical protein
MPSTFAIAVNRQRFVEKPGREMDWETFNSQFINVDNMDVMRFANAIYMGHAYCPQMTGKRKAENFHLAQHVAVDMDCGDQRASLDALRQHPLVQAYGAIIHETPSHTPEAPRARVIFLLDEPIHTAEGYRAALSVVTEQFPGADPACVDPARFFYGNGRLGAMQRTDGIWFAPEICLPLSELRRYARIQAERAKQQQTWTPPENGNGHGQPGNGERMNLDELGQRLAHVNPYSMGYDQWLKLIAAVRHVYGDGAFGAVKAWSDMPGHDPLTQAKWNSLQASHPNPAGYGTIVPIIKELGR